MDYGKEDQLNITRSAVKKETAFGAAKEASAKQEEALNAAREYGKEAEKERVRAMANDVAQRTGEYVERVNQKIKQDNSGEFGSQAARLQQVKDAASEVVKGANCLAEDTTQRIRHGSSEAVTKSNLEEALDNNERKVDITQKDEYTGGIAHHQGVYVEK